MSWSYKLIYSIAPNLVLTSEGQQPLGPCNRLQTCNAVIQWATFVYDYMYVMIWRKFPIK